MNSVANSNGALAQPVCVIVVLLDGDLVESPEHLGAAYLAACLREAGYRCEIIDIAPGEDETACQTITELEAPLVGLSLTTVNLPRAVKFGASLRQRLPDRSLLIGGGPIATFMGGRLLKNAQWDFLDGIVRGEGETVMVHLADKIMSGAPLDDVPGLVTRGTTRNQQQIAKLDRPLDHLPWPARDQLERRAGRLPYVRVSTSRGCTSRCTFCNAPHAGNNIGHSKLWRGREPKDVVDEIEHLYKTHGVDTFDFVDSTFEDPGGGKIGKERVRTIAEEILNRGLRIYYNICSQAKNWYEEDSELLELLFRSGAEKALLGIESGDDAALQLFRKASTVEDNYRAIRLFRTHGIYVAFGFIMFHPYSTWDMLRNNRDFLIDTLGHNLRRFITRLELYPGSEILLQLESDGLLAPDYFDTLEPYAYKYANPEIAHCAYLLNNLFGKDYLQQGSIKYEPSVFAFETFDIRMHTYYSRISRLHGADPDARMILEETYSEIERLKTELTEFNGHLFDEVLTVGKAGGILPSSMCQDLEEKYTQAIKSLQSIQMKCGMSLKRAGKELNFRAPLAADAHI